MIKAIKQGSIVFIRAAIKAVTGFFVVPMGILVSQVKPGWETASVPVKIFTGILLVPMVTFLNFTSAWWEGFDIVD